VRPGAAGSPAGRAWRPAGEGLAMGVAFAVFGLSVRGRPFPVALAGVALLAAAFLFVRGLRAPDGMGTVFGEWRGLRCGAMWLTAGVVAGGLLGMTWRASCEVAPLPPRLTGFVAVAALIGAAEEIVFRGFLQGRLCRLGPAIAVSAAALFHTAYKVALFASPAPGEVVDLPVLLAVTLLGGLGFGAARQAGGSVWPCVAAHAVFDIVGYGDRWAAPGWVWG